MTISADAAMPELASDNPSQVSEVDRRRMATLLTRKPRLSQRYRWLYPLAVWVNRAKRRVSWTLGQQAWATRRSQTDLPVKVKGHKSLLLRQLGESEMRLQHNKVTNLRLAVAEMDGILIAPGETFSFNKIVGNCTAKRGFVEGMRLSNGEAIAGIGGGICQLANLLYWMVLHSDLTVTERSEHSFDPFPDNGRVLPWGTGCSIVYNYVDLQFRNDTAATYQLRLAVGPKYLEGCLRADRAQPTSYKVYAKDERFYRLDGDYFRANDIRRVVIDKTTGNAIGDELLKHNCALVKYVPTQGEIVDVRDGAITAAD